MRVASIPSLLRENVFIERRELERDFLMRCRLIGSKEALTVHWEISNTVHGVAIPIMLLTNILRPWWSCIDHVMAQSISIRRYESSDFLDWLHLDFVNDDLDHIYNFLVGLPLRLYYHRRLCYRGPWMKRYTEWCWRREGSDVAGESRHLMTTYPQGCISI